MTETWEIPRELILGYLDDRNTCGLKIWAPDSLKDEELIFIKNEGLHEESVATLHFLQSERERPLPNISSKVEAFFPKERIYAFFESLLEIGNGNVGKAELRLFPEHREIFRLILQRSKADKTHIRLRLYVTKSSESNFRKVILKGRFSANTLEDQKETLKEIVDTTKPRA